MKNTNGNKFLLPLAFLFTVLFGTLILAVQRGPSQIQKEFLINEPAPRTVFSPIRVTYINEEETARLREEKQSQVPPVYLLDSKVKKMVDSYAEEFLKKQPSTAEKFSIEELARAVKLLSDHFLARGILDDSKKKELSDLGKDRIRVYDSETKAESEQTVKEVVSFSEVKSKARLFLEQQGIRDRSLRSSAVEIFTDKIHPNLLLDEAETREAVKKASDSVSPLMEGVKAGEMIVQKGLLVTPKEQERLTQVQKEMSKKEVKNRLLTVSIFMFLGLGISFLYFKLFDAKQFSSPRFLVLVTSIFLLTLLVERITLLFPAASLYLVPGSFAAILLTMLWSPTLGILGGLSISIASAPLVEFRVEIILMLLFGSLAGCFAARKIRKRIQFLKIGFAMGIINALVLNGFFFFQEWGFSEAMAVSPLGFANSFLVTCLAFFFVPIFELLFNLTTDITLLELSDLNHPLLKRMVVEAPGTYHHSLVVSTLAEGACEAIGANALLARVGCYFHDIGKIAHSEYFTENQTPQSGNRHEKLTPVMSRLVIMNHVKEGIDLARKNKLKEVIIRFIPEHQGTGVIYYFYKKALDQAAPGEAVCADDFRYPGPKPQSRETAVALLADSVEAASRSLRELNPPAIRAMVRKIINEKFIDGQLDECDLTLKDLHKIQESFVHNLMAIFHTRVRYPSEEPDPSRPDLFGENQFTKFH